MNDETPIALFRLPKGQGGRKINFPAPINLNVPNAFFNRHELKLILDLYGRMVAAGEWRDYAIDDDGEAVMFSIYRRSSEMPLYRIEKRPKFARKQGAFSIRSASGQILKRGQSLDTTLRFFDRKLLRLVTEH
jgi:Protein of unknown function (DUF2794)